MDDRTERLRELFLETTGEREVTEPRIGGRESRSSDDDTSVEAVVAAMRERYGFATDLDDAALATVVRLFFDGAADASVAADLDTDAGDVFEARMDLHLVTESDRAVPFDAERCRALLDDGLAPAGVAEELGPDVDPAAVTRHRRVVAADRESVGASHRWRDRFAELLTDDDLSGRLAASAREDGLEAAIEDIETDVEL